MELRGIDYLGISAFLLLQVALLMPPIGLSILQYIGALFLQIILGVAFKLFNMYRMDPQERVQKKRDEGLSGLFC